jgi:hypothetical protein
MSDQFFLEDSPKRRQEEDTESESDQETPAQKRVRLAQIAIAKRKQELESDSEEEEELKNTFKKTTKQINQIAHLFQKPKMTVTIPKRGATITVVQYHKNRIYTADKNGKLYLFNTKQKGENEIYVDRKPQIVNAHTKSILAMEISADKKVMVKRTESRKTQYKSSTFNQ